MKKSTQGIVRRTCGRDTGDNIIVSGDAGMSDVSRASKTNANNYIYGGSGNTIIVGSGGGKCRMRWGTRAAANDNKAANDEAACARRVAA